ncbi:hypothetical protein NQD34_009271 [Periophthalmus magnuspinnatus]|nr:hypothetical protein NQD34_009271 [Periophthalmus magnuspinnatus]
MVAKGTYTDLQHSGLDFTSLLQMEEEESHTPAPETQIRTRTLSQNSVLSQASSVHSAKDGDQLPAEAVQTVVETRAQGTISVGLYVKYLRAGANCLVVFLMLFINLLSCFS